ncbi:ATP-binding protein [Streptomyces sp. H27-C3]|uniref:ATP-binding protein n=1 Tax=Streptomyces sp. H27-C3 TaxID=3046305 RepID=UPI0024B8CF4B|nr:ATP-binding protein [Streptomyces sp. H27-C3]MDJ0461099.1 ATP-binding protein [Streptomyces sp. H27-C3]
MDVRQCEVQRKAWELPFLAEAREVAGLRRVMALQLRLWGLSELTDVAQLCVTELVTNVITHVGYETPTTLAVSMAGTRLRIEVRDPDARALPTLLAAMDGDETGRGMAIIDAITDRWGVILRADSKVTWCELRTDLATPSGHTGGKRVSTVEALLARYCEMVHPRACSTGPLEVAVAEEVAINLIADLLHWLRAHGCDPDEALDRAQMSFEVEVGEVA